MIDCSRHSQRPVWTQTLPVRRQCLSVTTEIKWCCNSEIRRVVRWHWMHTMFVYYKITTNTAVIHYGTYIHIYLYYESIYNYHIKCHNRDIKIYMLLMACFLHLVYSTAGLGVVVPEEPCTLRLLQVLSHNVKSYRFTSLPPQRCVMNLNPD